MSATGDFVDDGKQGYIIDIRDSDAIVEKIEHMSKNPELLKLMSESSKATFMDYQTKEDNYRARVKRLYSEN